MTELGAEIAEFRTNNGTRAGLALIGLVVGGVAGPIGWVWGTDGAGPAPVALLLLGAVGVGIGLGLLVAVLRHRGERFTLYEQGVTRVVGRRRIELRWADIAAVRIVDTNAHSACTLKLSSGGRLRFTGFTSDARSLADWIRAAVEDGATPRRC